MKRWWEKRLQKGNVVNEHLVFPPEEKDVYTITEWYADQPINAVGNIGLVGRELQIFLNDHDWYKFQSQPFYPELIRYLDNLRTQKNT